MLQLRRGCMLHTHWCGEAEDAIVDETSSSLLSLDELSLLGAAAAAALASTLCRRHQGIMHRW